MAGVGFELRQAIHEDNHLSAIRGYLYAAVISAGPWLLAVVTLSLLGLISTSFLSPHATVLFGATITHTFAISLITTGLIQMVVTRYLADQLYLDRTDLVAPTFVSVVVLSAGAQFVLINVLLISTDLPLSYRLSAAILYVAVSEIWIAMIFLSAARDYVSIALSFAVGYLVSFVAAIGLGSDFGAHAFLMGFAAGQVLTLGLLTARVLTEFETTEFFNFEFVGYFRRYPALIGIGFFYSLALWADKIAFWLSPQGMDVGTYLKIFPPYDTIFFVASLVSFVPALVMFTVHLETDFYEYYIGFYAAIQDRSGLGKLLEAKEGMARSIRTSYLALLKVQSGLVLLVVTLLTPIIMHVFAIPQELWDTFRVVVVAMSGQVFLLYTTLILQYLDMRGSVLIVYSVFLATNLGFAVPILLGHQFYGYGFLAASIISMITAFILLAERFKKLEYLTFMRQPV